MSGFKVGDQVRVKLQVDGRALHSHRGHVGKVVESEDPDAIAFPIRVRFDNGEQNLFDPIELELLEPPADAAAEVEPTPAARAADVDEDVWRDPRSPEQLVAELAAQGADHVVNEKTVDQVRKEFNGGMKFVLRVEDNGGALVDVEVLDKGRGTGKAAILFKSSNKKESPYNFVDAVLQYMLKLNREAAASQGEPLPQAPAEAGPKRVRLHVQRVPRRRS